MPISVDICGIYSPEIFPLRKLGSRPRGKRSCALPYIADAEHILPFTLVVETVLLARLEKREDSGLQIIANSQDTSKPGHCASPDAGILGAAYNCDGVKIRRTRQAYAIETLCFSVI